MSQLEFYTGLSTVWIAIAWVPYVLDRIMVRGLAGSMANPSPDLAPQSDWAVRAKAAHVVAIQAFSAFAPLAILAMIRIPEDGYPNILAITFFIGIFAHYVFYAIGSPVLRTLSFSLAALSTSALGLRVLGFI
jgi:uncharacterized MAPEG superfamily protein